MGFVAIKGGEEAIKNSLSFFHTMIEENQDLEPEQIEHSLRYAVDKVISEGSLYSKKLSSLAIQKSGGDLFNAAFMLRAHRSSCARVGTAMPIDTDEMRISRRISSAFKDIEGGQFLGASNDYEVKLILEKSKDKTLWDDYSHDNIFLESALKPLRDAQMIKVLPKDDETSDVTRVFPTAPYPRSSVMQIMSRGESGSMLAFAYTSMRGYGDVHPTIGDLRLGNCDIYSIHPFTKNKVKIAEIDVTACESVATFEKQKNGDIKLTNGFGFCFGFNETKAISMSILDTTLYNTSYSIGEGAIANDFEMIIHHIDAIESTGFTNHYKLPHYVTFQSDLKVYENTKKFNTKKEENS